MKGAESKEKIFTKLKEVFPQAFFVGAKEFRIPMIEDGAPVEIKVALTAAKDVVGCATMEDVQELAFPKAEKVTTPMTEEEIGEVRDVLKRLNL